jgi:hypothetical protein
VIVPKRIHRPYPQADGDVDPQNLVLDGSTSPAWWGLPANTVKLVTAWIHWLTVTVEDQFGTVLDDLYEGVEVQEKIGSSAWRSINQPLSADGTYQDPVGVNQWPAVSEVPAGGQAAQDWPTQPTLTMQARRIPQRIGVKVGGHSIGTIRRTVIATPPNHVEVEWP